MAKQKVAKRPTRDEFVLEEIGNQLVEAKQEDSEILGPGRTGAGSDHRDGFSDRESSYSAKWRNN